MRRSGIRGFKEYSKRISARIACRRSSRIRAPTGWASMRSGWRGKKSRSPPLPAGMRPAPSGLDIRPSGSIVPMRRSKSSGLPPMAPAQAFRTSLPLRACNGCLFFRLERPRQQAFDRRVDRYLAAQDRRDGIRYRHIDVSRGRQFDQSGRGELTLGELVARRGFTAAERDAECEIARLKTRATQDQIAKAGQSRQRFAARAAGAAEPGEFAEAACGQRRLRRGAEFSP